MSPPLLALDPQRLCESAGALAVVPRTVQIWGFALAASAKCRAQCEQTLSEAERNRAARFSDHRLGEHYIVAHGVLRLLLARYCGLAARELAFLTGERGKPRLATGAAGLSFNMSHSHAHALIAVSDGRELGIDLERVDPAVKTLDLARRYFCASEIGAVEAAADELRACAFFDYWVAKEAVLKGAGIGLKFPIDRFEVQFASADSAHVRSHDSAALADDWTVRMLPVGSDWRAALAVRGADCALDLTTQTLAHR